MSYERQLIDIIKSHFARKSSEQLQEIAGAADHERWSAQAVTAAIEVLHERLSGGPQGPAVGAEDAPPPLHYEPGDIALGVLSGLFAGVLFVPFYRRVEHPDLPIPFGPRMAWLAVETTDTRAVVAALKLRATREATWEEGLAGAHRDAVFVTPPLADWTLAVGAPLFPLDLAVAEIQPLLERLSQEFGQAQYFCTYQDIGLHVWAQARRGRLVRGYGWLGEFQRALWDDGPRTKEEHDLGLPSTDGPDENGVMQLACLWSLDPSGLDEQFLEPESGILGTLAKPGSARNKNEPPA